MCVDPFASHFRNVCVCEFAFHSLDCDVKVQWARASRTDKGVHALHNVISAKLLVREGEDMAGRATQN